jgi:hypothetical protein
VANLFSSAEPKPHSENFGPPTYNIVTCLLKAGKAEREDTAFVKERLCKHVSTVKVYSE